jgi:16S rRNA (guanine(1405)-N(7))-methyltransferase
MPSNNRKIYTDQDVVELVQKITNSKKYRTIHRNTIERIVKQCLEKYEMKQVEKKARNILHRVWSTYYLHRPDFGYLLDELKKNLSFGIDTKNCVLSILPIQSSTRERIPLLNRFYQDIFLITGCPSSIIDHGCGLNPLTTPWMKLPKSTKYHGFDIDGDQIQFLQAALQLLGLEDQIKASLADVMVDRFDYVDVVFMLKLLPLLEQQSKGSSLEIMQKQQCEYMVISFPIKSLSGNERGMTKFYSSWFKNVVKNEPWKYEELLFETELVFVIRK